MRKTILVLTMVALLLVTACSNEGGNNTNKPESNAEAGAADKNDALEAIKSKGKLVIATSGNYRPITFMNEQGKLDGLDIELGTMIAEELGVEVEFVPGNLAGLIPGLTSGKFDLVMSGLLATDERKKSIDFSAPYGQDGVIAVTKEGDAKVTDVSKLDGLVVGVIGGSGTHTVVQGIGGYKELKEYPGNAEAFTDLKAGRMDVYATGNIASTDYIKNDKSNEKLKLVGEVYAIKEMGIGLRKEESELRAFLDEFIETKKSDGTIDKLAVKWIGKPFK
ncbi:substrate-binding periplasmic protein [Paenibacillus sp. GCM10023252]|uniref:substrate-binding periplasmic protein n=1 Tax=Paenibacillus sp. GCM10023252 TaxID=3252649 RepID=UPI003607BAC0